MIITLDGPAGAGKSTVAQEVARQLGFQVLDTGAMYRCVALQCMQQGISYDDEPAVTRIAGEVSVDFDWQAKPPVVLLNGNPVEHQIRSPQVSQGASRIAVYPGVREKMVQQQRRIGSHGNYISEGRDQGTVVFPDAPVKFYLDASPQERARRRVEQMKPKGVILDYQLTLDEIIQRDQRDSSRSTGPLSIPQGAEYLDTTGMPADIVVQNIVQRARASI